MLSSCLPIALHTAVFSLHTPYCILRLSLFGFSCAAHIQTKCKNPTGLLATPRNYEL